jgi:diacylglycerol kinase (ATP)
MSNTPARRLARRVKRVARDAAQAEHAEDSLAREIVRIEAAARIQELLAPVTSEPGSAGPQLPALLIVNSKSGPAHDSLLRVRELVDLLATHGIAAEVRVKLHKSQARREARAAARAGYALVIAAGGDGTISSVARGLVGSKTVLGIVPLGTYNNVATSLGIPTDLAQACALIAAAPVRAIDVGEVFAAGMKRPRAFLEVGAVGIAAPLAVAGQGFEKGRWDAVTRHLPQALEMAPALLGVRIDGQRGVQRAQGLLVIVANTPRAGAGLLIAPQARLDDGLLNVRVYEEMSQVVLATHFLAITAGTASVDMRVRSSTGRRMVIRSSLPLPVVADSKVVGRTPARFRVVTGGLLVIAGSGDGLSHPVAQSLLSAIKDHHDAPFSQAATSQTAEVAVATTPARLAGAQLAGAQLARRRGPAGIALAVGTAIALTPIVARWLARRRR